MLTERVRRIATPFLWVRFGPLVIGVGLGRCDQAEIGVAAWSDRAGCTSYLRVYNKRAWLPQVQENLELLPPLPLHFLVSGWSGLTKRAFPSQCRLNPPGSSCYRSQQTSPSAPSASQCSEVGSRNTSPLSDTLSLFTPQSFLFLLSRPWSGPESPFAQSESSSFAIGRTDPPSTLHVSDRLCTTPLSTTFLSEPYHDVIITYPAASDKWSMSHSSQRRVPLTDFPCSISTSWHAPSSRHGLCLLLCTSLFK
jgi:hypothetical protein